MTKAFITKAAYARYRNVSAQRISTLVKQNKIVLDEIGRVDVAKSDKILGDLVDPSRTPNVKSSGKEMQTNSEAMFQAKLDKTLAETEVQRLKIQEHRNSLVPVDAVKMAAFGIARLMRDNMLSLPDRLASRLAHENDEHEIRVLLTEEFKIILRQSFDSMIEGHILLEVKEVFSDTGS